MIDENLLVKNLRKGQAVIQDKLDNVSVSAIYETINAVIDEIYRQPQVDKWIPCEERLPENDTNVIACFSCGTVTELRYLGNGIFQGIYKYSTKVIIAWQPLPQPYKKEGAE